MHAQYTVKFNHLCTPVSFHAQNAPAVSVYLTFFGVVLGFLSTFWSWSYTRLSRRLFSYLSSPTLDGTKQVCMLMCVFLLHIPVVWYGCRLCCVWCLWCVLRCVLRFVCECSCVCISHLPWLFTALGFSFPLAFHFPCHPLHPPPPLLPCS